MWYFNIWQIQLPTWYCSVIHTQNVTLLLIPTHLKITKFEMSPSVFWIWIQKDSYSWVNYNFNQWIKDSFHTGKIGFNKPTSSWRIHIFSSHSSIMLYGVFKMQCLLYLDKPFKRYLVSGTLRASASYFEVHFRIVRLVFF